MYIPGILYIALLGQCAKKKFQFAPSTPYFRNSIPISWFAVPKVALTGHHNAHFKITHSTLPNSKSHTSKFKIAHLQFPNSVLLKYEIAHIQIANCVYFAYKCAHAHYWPLCSICTILIASLVMTRTPWRLASSAKTNEVACTNHVRATSLFLAEEASLQGFFVIARGRTIWGGHYRN